MKNHHSLVLRAESASDKYMWLARLKNASDGGGAPGGKPPVRGYTSEQLRAASVTSSAAPTPRSEGRPPRQGGVRMVCGCSLLLLASFSSSVLSFLFSFEALCP